MKREEEKRKEMKAKISGEMTKRKALYNGVIYQSAMPQYLVI